MAIRDMAGGLFRWMAGAVVPMFARPIAPIGLAWFVHVLLVAAIAVGLYFAQPHLRVTEVIQKGPVEFRPFWLTALFLLLYALAWSAAWLWQLLSPGQPVTDFPDIDVAWDEITAALAKAGIGVADTPIYLVLGEYPSGFEALFRALPNGLTVAGGSAPGSPIRAFANRDGIYLAVPGASLLGIQSWVGGDGGGEVESGAGGSMMQSVGIGASIGIDQSVGISIGGSVVGSVGVGGPLQEIQRIIRRARDENRPLTEEEKRRVRELSGSGPGPAPAAKPVAASSQATAGSVLQNARLVAEANARLDHVCGLVAQARWPLCPLNGAVLTVPAAASDREDGAQQWGLVAREDLARAEAAFQLRFPVYALVGGVEMLPGGLTFFERFAAEKGAQRLGKSFPLNPDLPPAAAGAEVEKATRWVFGSLLPYHVFKQTRTDAAADSRENAALVRFLIELRRRAPRLARLVGRAVGTEHLVPEFGGCYLAVSLPGEAADVKFAREFFKKVESSQGSVAWTDAAYAEDASYRSMTRMGYLALVAIALAVVALAGYVGYEQFVAKK
jgi:ImcF (intracellular multiplication and macrophage-killing)-related protein